MATKSKQKITPFLWYDSNAEEAVNFYVSLFDNSKVISFSRYGEGGPMPNGTVMSAVFELEGIQYYAMNGGPMFKFSPAVSLFVNAETQEEIDRLYNALSEGGSKEQCGWLKDKFGLSWQIVPPHLGQMLQDKDPEKAKRVMQAMLKMTKLEIQKLKDAYEGS